MMRLIPIAFLLLFQAMYLRAQFREDFTDGDLSMDPIWSGESNKFTIENGELRLMDTLSTGSAFLSTPLGAMSSVTWEFDFRLLFNPSSSNYLEVVLFSDSPDLGGKELFIRIGDSSDDISLWFTDGQSMTQLVDGADDRTDSSSPGGRIRALLADGKISVFSMLESDTAEFHEGTVGLSADLRDQHFGLRFRYSPTRSNKFYLDNIVVQGEPWSDVVAPVVKDMELSSGDKIFIRYSEPVTGGEVAANYQVEPGGYFPATVVFQQGRYQLIFMDRFLNGQSSELRISHIADSAGNELDTLISFVFIEEVDPKSRMVIVNEVNFRPSGTGPQGVEYIELLNREDRPVRVDNWVLEDGHTYATFPAAWIPAKRHVLIVPSGTASLFDQKSVEITEWPSLNNSGDTLRLWGDNGTLIDKMWYRGTWSEVPGVSLERAHPDYLCHDELLWRPSGDPLGGTPGKGNSVTDSHLMSSPPMFSEIWYKDGLNIRFEGPVFADSVKVVLPGSFHPFGILQYGADQMAITLSREPVPSQLYPLQLQRWVGCSGLPNRIPIELEWGLSDSATWNDMVISEVLPDPVPGGTEYIELFNRSRKLLDLADFTIRGTQGTRVLSGKHQLVRPGDWIAFSGNAPITRNHYPRSSGLILTADIPSLPNDEGVLVLYYRQSPVDSVVYDRNWHFPYISDPEGVSLERIDPDLEGWISSNWTSASSLSGYGTPGSANSRKRGSPGNSGLSIHPRILFPDNSGRDDILHIDFDLGNGSWMLSARIFSLDGTLVKWLANNKLVSSCGSLIWNGFNEKGMKPALGIYLVILEAYDDKGNTKILKGTVVLGPS